MKEKFLQETESAAPGDTRMIRKWNSLTADVESVSGRDRRAKQPPHSLKASLTPSKARAFLHSVKAEWGEEAAEGRLEAAEVGS